METNSEKTKSLKQFFKRYGYYFILIGCIMALALIITLAAVTDQSYNQSVEVNTNTVEFVMPVANATIESEFSDSELMFNETLGQWEAHMGIDLCAEAGSEVVAVYDGKVSKIYTNTLEGTVIIIDHANGIQTVYSSLDSEVDVSEGDEVKKGDKIGKVSDSATKELHNGNHIHFEVRKDGKKVDPSTYINLSKK